MSVGACAIFNKPLQIIHRQARAERGDWITTDLKRKKRLCISTKLVNFLYVELDQRMRSRPNQ